MIACGKYKYFSSIYRPSELPCSKPSAHLDRGSQLEGNEWILCELCAFKYWVSGMINKYSRKQKSMFNCAWIAVLRLQTDYMTHKSLWANFTSERCPRIVQGTTIDVTKVWNKHSNYSFLFLYSQISSISNLVTQSAPRELRLLCICFSVVCQWLHSDYNNGLVWEYFSVSVCEPHISCLIHGSYSQEVHIHNYSAWI